REREPRHDAAQAVRQVLPVVALGQPTSELLHHVDDGGELLEPQPERHLPRGQQLPQGEQRERGDDPQQSGAPCRRCRRVHDAASRRARWWLTGRASGWLFSHVRAVSTVVNGYSPAPLRTQTARSANQRVPVTVSGT